MANDDSSTAESTSSQETLHSKNYLVIVRISFHVSLKIQSFVIVYPAGLDIPSADSAHTVIRKLTGTAFIFQHVTALLMKRFYNSRRNLKGLFCEVESSPTSTNSFEPSLISLIFPGLPFRLTSDYRRSRYIVS